MKDIFENSGTFTRNAWEWLYETVDHDQFLDRDTDLIYQSLEQDFKPVHFGRYLQHYIFKKTGMEGTYTDISLKDYQTIITDAFRENGTPGSFTPTTAKLSALAKNWLTQQSVKRQAVLLLGFGLRMSAEEVNEFLYKALLEPMLNDRNALEAVCKYCYQHGYGFYKFRRLWQIYEQLDPDHPDLRLIYDAQPQGRAESGATAQEDVRLMNALMGLKKQGGSRPDEVSFERFSVLYDQARHLVFALSGTDRKRWEDVSESDLERILCSAIPMSENGNLISARESTLHAQFEGKRFSRKRINDILLRKTEPERFDLITLNFLIYSLQVEQEPNPQKRYIRFIESTNRILADCFMGPVYVTNPYECFVLMCMLSVSPLETYNDVIEKSYQPEPVPGE